MSRVAVFVIAHAQATWTQFALSTALLLGSVSSAGCPPRSCRSSSGGGGAVLVYSFCGAVRAAVSRIINQLEVFAVQGGTGDIASGVEWSGPSGVTAAGHPGWTRRGA